MHATRFLRRALFAALSCGAVTGTALAAEPELETVARVDEAPGNIAVAPDGTVVISVHPALPSGHLALAIRDGEASPFPNRELSARNGAGALQPMLGMRADRNSRVWMLSSAGGQHLYAWDLNSDSLVHDFGFADSPATVPRSNFNDIALALDHDTVFISDSAGDEYSALVALNLKDGSAIRRLQGHPSMRAEDIVARIDGRALGSTGPDGEFSPLRGSLNPLTIDSGEEWVYYGAMSGETIYRVRVADLLDTGLSETELGARVERYAEKPASAGITIDDAGNIYVADFQSRAIGVAAPGREYRILVSDAERLSWPDGISVGPDGYVYTGANQLHRNFSSHRDGGPPQAPYYITRVKALADTTVGR